MKRAAILILFCAAALPAAVVAQTAEQTTDTPLIGTKWSLKQPKQKVVGPRVPPAPRLRAPQARAAQRAARPAPRQRPNNAPLVAAIKKAKRR